MIFKKTFRKITLKNYLFVFRFISLDNGGNWHRFRVNKLVLLKLHRLLIVLI